jgi:hypothetical protein
MDNKCAHHGFHARTPQQILTEMGAANSVEPTILRRRPQRFQLSLNARPAGIAGNRTQNFAPP